MKKDKFIILYSLFFVFSLYFVDQVMEIIYLYKVIYKIVLIIISYFLGKKYYNINFNFLFPKKLKKYKLGIIISLISFISIFIVFSIIKNSINLAIIKDEFLNKYQLDGIKFFIASFYLIIFNSFIEEYFFRGFIFLNLSNKKNANLFSSIMFSIYHISNFKNWLSKPILLLLPIIGLIASGMLFNYLSSINKDIYNSYIPHMFADLAIVIIGYVLIIH